VSHYNYWEPEEVMGCRAYPHDVGCPVAWCEYNQHEAMCGVRGKQAACPHWDGRAKSKYQEEVKT
jgi:hypothetical protein